MEYSVELELSSPFMEQWTLDAGGVLCLQLVAGGAVFEKYSFGKYTLENTLRKNTLWPRPSANWV